MRKASAGATGVASGGSAMGSEAGNTGRRWQPVIRSVLFALVAVHCSPRTTPTGGGGGGGGGGFGGDSIPIAGHMMYVRSEEHTSELQSRLQPERRLLLEKKTVNRPDVT